MFRFPKLSLRIRLFAAMVFLLVFSGLLIFLANYYQYQSEEEDYHLARLTRKQMQIQRHLNRLAEKHTLYGQPESEWQQFLDDFEAITKIHNVSYSLFSTAGNPIYIKSYLPLEIVANNYRLSDTIKTQLKQNPQVTFLEKNEDEVEKHRASYSVLYDASGNAYGILFFPYFFDVSFAEDELNNFFDKLYKIYLLLLLIAIVLAYFLARYVTQSLETIRVKMDQTGLLKSNQKIHLRNATKEIDSLVNSYNNMIDALEESIEKLAKTEREQAWQEMARQVAHEVKNPLTPMRLTIQSFQQRFDKNDPEITQKLNDFSKTLIQQIDIMVNVAEAFSDFATLPKPKKQACDLIEITKLAVDIFNRKHVSFSAEKENVLYELDRTQWIRVMTNLIQNALQSVPKNRKPKVKIALKDEKEAIAIVISDNGSGISPSLEDKIFEPKFTTKTGGMGLGLGIVKNIIASHGGTISYVSELEKGTVFKILLKK